MTEERFLGNQIECPIDIILPFQDGIVASFVTETDLEHTGGYETGNRQ